MILIFLNKDLASKIEVKIENLWNQFTDNNVSPSQRKPRKMLLKRLEYGIKNVWFQVFCHIYLLIRSNCCRKSSSSLNLVEVLGVKSLTHIYTPQMKR